jgi:hypothetical protein
MIPGIIFSPVVVKMFKRSAVVNIQVRKRPNGQSSVGRLGDISYLIVGQTIRNIQMPEHVLGTHLLMENRKHHQQQEDEIFASFTHRRKVAKNGANP